MVKRLNVSKDCCGCTACESICPQHCIEMKKNEEGFLYPIVEKDKCIECGLCQKVCMIGVKTQQKEVLQTYAAMNCDLDTRMASSSGGIFALLAKKIISENGIVFGAAFSDDYKAVHHITAVNNSELQKMYGSKYVQSDLHGIYPQVKKALEEGKKVLFTGTPCQINGLRYFLGKNYENLLLIDIICHGVPSPTLWSKYVSSIENKYHSSVTNVNFRSKQCRNREFGMNRIDEQNRELFILKDQDPYMQMFLRNYCLRQSCYQCSAKESRFSDMTIGDYWGIEYVIPEMNDGMGTSAVIVRTEKGKEYLSHIVSHIKLKKTEYQTIVRHNSAEVYSVNKPSQRERFFEDMNSKSFFVLQRKYLKRPLKIIVRNLLIRMGIWSIIRPMKLSKKRKNNAEYFLVFTLRQNMRNNDFFTFS